MTEKQLDALAAMATALRIAQSYTEHNVTQPRGPNERHLHTAAVVGLRLAEEAGLIKTAT